MNSKAILIRLKVVFLPFLLIAITTVAGYTGLRWLLEIELGALHLKEDLLNFWIPIFLPWIPILVFMRKRVRILAVRGKSDNGHFLYQLIMGLAIAATIIVVQQYMVKASYRLNEVTTAGEIAQFPAEKYFKVESYEVDKNNMVPYYTANVSGKHSQDFNFLIYYASPFRGGENNVWLGVHRHDRVSNGGTSDEEKDEAFEIFADQCWEEFHQLDFWKATYFERVPFSDDQDGYFESIKQSPLYANETIEDVVILTASYEPFEARTGSSFQWIFYSFLIGSFIVLLMVAIPKTDRKEYTAFVEARPQGDDELKEFLQYLNPFGEYKLAAILININIAVFIWMIAEGASFMSPTATSLLDLGGLRRAEVLNGEYWRLVSCMFMHAGVAHLIMNMFGLMLAAIILRDHVRPILLGLAYLTTGIMAGLASIWWHENTVSVGASGAIFGLFGIIASFNLFKRFGKEGGKSMWALLAIYAGVSLVLGFFGNSDNAAHFGGLLGGIIVGAILAFFTRSGSSNTDEDVS